VRLRYVFTFDTPKAVAGAFAKSPGCSYLFLSRMQQATEEMLNGVPPGYWEAAQHGLISSGLFSVIYKSPHATILVVGTGGPSNCRGPGGL
jgi:hypothetical protein